MTPRGVLTNILLVTYMDFHYADFGWCDEYGRRLLLCLTPRSGSVQQDQDSKSVFDVAQYFLIRHGQHVSQSSACRLLRIYPAFLDSVSLTRLQAYLAYGVPGNSEATGTQYLGNAEVPVPRLPLDTSLDAPFRLHKYALAELWRTHHAVLKPELNSDTARSSRTSTPSECWDAPVVFSLVFPESLGWVDVRLGICAREFPSQPKTAGGSRVHWANVRCCTECPASRSQRHAQPTPGPTDLGHNCPEDHISRWAGLEKTFRIANGHLFTLCFARCGLLPERTMVLLTIRAELAQAALRY